MRTLRADTRWLRRLPRLVLRPASVLLEPRRIGICRALLGEARQGTCKCGTAPGGLDVLTGGAGTGRSLHHPP